MFKCLIAELHDSKIKIKLSNRVYNILRVSAGHSSEKESESDCACDSASPKFSNKMVNVSISLSIFFESLWILISRIIRVSLSLSLSLLSLSFDLLLFFRRIPSKNSSPCSIIDAFSLTISCASTVYHYSYPLFGCWENLGIGITFEFFLQFVAVFVVLYLLGIWNLKIYSLSKNKFSS